MTNTELIEKKDLREQLIGRIEVLDKVKKLFLIPEMEVMTTKMVADYFEVEKSTIELCYQRNKKGINEDGVNIKSSKAFLNLQNVITEKQSYKTIVKISDTVTLEIPNRGIRCFSKRAILRVAMLLRDSKIAQEVRTQLLNTFEHATDEQKTLDINEETNIMLEIGRAAISGDIQRINEAYTSAIAFKNRHITKLEESNVELSRNNKALAGEILEWEDRACLNKAIRIIANTVHTKYAYVWKDLYEELLYKHGIGLKMRGKSPYIQYVKENEWKFVIQSLAAICEDKNISVSNVFKKAKISNK